jgi:hypothetical protein
VIDPPQQLIPITSSGKPSWNDLNPVHYSTVQNVANGDYFIIVFDINNRPMKISERCAQRCESRFNLTLIRDRLANAMTDNNVVRDPKTEAVIRLHMPPSIFESRKKKLEEGIELQNKIRAKSSPELYSLRVLGGLIATFVGKSLDGLVSNTFKPGMDKWKLVASMDPDAQQEQLEANFKTKFLNVLQTQRDSQKTELTDDDIATLFAYTCMDELYVAAILSDPKLYPGIRAAIDRYEQLQANANHDIEQTVEDALDIEQQIQQENIN